MYLTIATSEQIPETKNETEPSLEFEILESRI